MRKAGLGQWIVRGNGEIQGGIVGTVGSTWTGFEGVDTRRRGRAGAHREVEDFSEPAIRRSS